MDTLLQYVRLRKDLYFSERAFNPVDALVFAELGYVNWEKVIDEKPLKLADACKLYYRMHTPDELKKRFVFSQNIPDLVREMQDCPRFQNVKISHYQSVMDENIQIQFAAVTFELPDGTLVISYRGTDGSMTGWKENMQMSYRDRMPCHDLARDYAKEVFEAVPETKSWFGLVHKKIYPKIYIVGHSKGGHLAMAAALLNPEVQDAITHVYAFDAPGFRPGFYDALENRSVLSRILNVKPKDSVIGCLLEHQEEQIIVDSLESGLSQHDVFRWGITTDSFKEVNSLSEQSCQAMEKIEKMLMSKSDEEKKEYTDLIFSIMDKLDITSVAHLTEIRFKKVALGALELRNMNHDERKFIYDIIGYLIMELTGKLDLKP